MVSVDCSWLMRCNRLRMLQEHTKQELEVTYGMKHGTYIHFIQQCILQSVAKAYTRRYFSWQHITSSVSVITATL